MKDNKIQDKAWQEMRAKRFKLTDTESLCDWSEEFDRVYLKAYKCGYETATKQIGVDVQKKNIVTDSTATILYKNGYEAGCTESLQAVKRFMTFKIKSLPIKKEYAELYKEIDTLLKEMTEKKGVKQ